MKCIGFGKSLKFFVGCLLFLVVGCASVVAPKSFNQSLHYATSTATAITNTTNDLLKRDRISVVKAAKIEEDLEYVYMAISNARIAKSINDEKAAMNYLTTASQVLVRLESQLKDLK